MGLVLVVRMDGIKDESLRMKLMWILVEIEFA